MKQFKQDYKHGTSPTEAIETFRKYLVPQLDDVHVVTPELTFRFFTEELTETKRNNYFDVRQREWDQQINIYGKSLELTEKALHFWAADLKRPIPRSHPDHDLIEAIRTIYEDYRGRMILVTQELKQEAIAMSTWLEERDSRKRVRRRG